jgi:hypothetical protein
MWRLGTSPIVLLAFLVLLPLAAARADYVTGLDPRGENFLALRTGPGTAYRTIYRMGPDTVLTVLQRRGPWVRARLEDGTEGWAFGEYIREGSPPGYETVPGVEEAEPGAKDEFSFPEAETPAPAEKAPAPVAGRWTVYGNDRFGTTIEYPAGLFRMLPPPENDDGRSFKARQGGASFIVFGSHNVFEKSLAELRDEDVAGGGYDAVTYRRSGHDWYVLSGYRGGEIFYRKVMLSGDGAVIHTFEMTYPKQSKSLFDPVTARMAKSMATGEAVPDDEPEATAPVGPEIAPVEAGPAESTTQAEEPEAIPDVLSKEPVLTPIAQLPLSGETPLPSAEILFGGKLGDRWEPYAAGGDFARDARLEDDALVVKVPKDNGEGAVGLLSPKPLVWLDDFGPNAETLVTFRFDPTATTGFVISLAVPGTGGVGGNPPGRPDATMVWSQSPDGTSATAELNVDLTRRKPFRTLMLPAQAPKEVTVAIRPHEVAWRINEGEEIVAAFPEARDGQGLRVYAYSHAPAWKRPGRDEADLDYGAAKR